MTAVAMSPRGAAPWRVRPLLTQLVFSGRIAAEAVAHNRLRAGLTALGILFGVASVIAMLSIGTGTEHEILEQMQLLGANTIVVTPILDQTDDRVSDKNDKKPSARYTPGLTALDAAAIRAVIPAVVAASSEVVLNRVVLARDGRYRAGTLVGVDASYFRVMHVHVGEGAGFTWRDFQAGAPVAIIGRGVQARFFPTEAPVGHRIKVGQVWLTVVGVLAPQAAVASATAARLGIRDATMDVYVPLATMLLRFRNRAAITQADFKAAAMRRNTQSDSSQTDQERAERRNRNQLDEVIVQVDQAAAVPAVADVVRRLLQHRHNDVPDVTVTVPEQLLQQEEDTKRLFNLVLGAIASISLLVGGIGIMNIMLASILERTKEIGVRRAMGATRQDVLGQFLTEAVMISLAGGIAGILLGVLFSVAIARLAHITTIIAPLSVAIAFGVSVAVGLVFGLMPARTAARQDPIECLRYE